MKLFTRHIESLDVDTNVKQALLHGDLIRKQHFYVHLIDYLAPLFPAIPVEQLERLSFSSYLYFRFLLEFDALIDGQQVTRATDSCLSSKFGKLFISFGLYEKAVRELSGLFPEGSSFWEAFESLKKQYFDTVCLEKQISIERGDFPQPLFEKIAAGKSAICLAAVYALGCLNGVNPHESALSACLRHIHIAFQYLDDIDDFKKDIETRQYTYPYALVNKHLHAQKINPAGMNMEKRYKYLFISGLAEQLIGEALQHYNNALKITQQLELDALTDFVEREIEQCRCHLEEINHLMTKARLKAEKSHQVRSLVPSAYLNAIPQSIQFGLSYMSDNMDSDYFWLDFLTSAGLGKHWVTAYAGAQLAEMGQELNILDKAAGALFGGLSNAGAFNETVIQDGDSTNFMVAFRREKQLGADIQLLSDWLNFENGRGGWVTYRDETALKNRLKLSPGASVGGWLTPKVCVTAAAAYVLSSFDELEPVFRRTADYLVRSQSKQGCWKSYWWTSPVYATSFAVMALSRHQAYRSHCQEAVKWLLSKQQPDGCWLNEMTGQPNAFYTALALKALMRYDFDSNREVVLQGINWLLQNQTSDGSWIPGRILRIPAPDVEDADYVDKWRQSSFGTNVIVDDHNRIFTTATAVNTLHLFHKLANG